MTPKDVPMLEARDEKRSCGVGILTAGKVTLPLAKVGIACRVADRVAETTVTQTFRNPNKDSLEAVYIFPLRGGCAVSDFEMRVGDRVIRGKVEERAAAQKKYQKALEQGKRAALLEQERDDVFTVQVGNLPPGEEVTVKIAYSERLPFFENGSTELRLPLVVAPRYIPGAPLDRDPVGEGTGPDTDQVPDASRLTPPRLVEGFDPQVGLNIEVSLADGDVADLACSQHATRTAIAAGAVTVTLARKDELLDRDFVLRWRLAKENVRPTVLVHRDAEGTAYGMLSLLPPKRDGFLGVARDVLFLLDRSGSMGGVKMTSAARACSTLLATLGPRDRFAIGAFDDVVEWFDSGKFAAADEAGIERGDKFLRTIDARGGTELDPALDGALKTIRARSEAAGRVPIIVLITDGEVGNESQILKRIQKELGEARVFTVGIDTAVNEGFLKRLAALGGGTSTFVVPGEALEEALRAVGREIGTPLVIDVKIDGVEDSAPAHAPDLFAGRAATSFFKIKKGNRVRVSGRFADGGKFDETVEAREVSLPAIARLWARARVMDLEDRFRLDGKGKDEIVAIALKHTLLTRFTAFVVVDESEIVNKDGTRRKIVQPVHMPARWEMDEETDKSATTMFAPMACAAPMLDGSIRGAALDDGICDETAAPSPAAPPPPPKAQPMPLMAGKKKTPPAGLRPAEAAGAAAAQAGPSISPAERKEAEEAILAMGKALADAWAAIEAGKVPPVDPLVKARAALLKALATDLGMQLGSIQRFLRSAAVELIAALRTPGVTAAQLSGLFERHAKAFEQARKEAAHILAGKSAPDFWEQTV